MSHKMAHSSISRSATSFSSRVQTRAHNLTSQSLVNSIALRSHSMPPTTSSTHLISHFPKPPPWCSGKIYTSVRYTNVVKSVTHLARPMNCLSSPLVLNSPKQSELLNISSIASSGSGFAQYTFGLANMLFTPWAGMSVWSVEMRYPSLVQLLCFSLSNRVTISERGDSFRLCLKEVSSIDVWLGIQSFNPLTSDVGKSTCSNSTKLSDLSAILHFCESSRVLIKYFRYGASR